MGVTLESASAHLKRIGYSNTFPSNVILVREALERGITITKTERFNFIQLEFDGKVRRWRAGRNSLNTALATRVTRYKDVTSALLRSQGVNATENILVEQDDVDRAWAWAQPLDATILKSNNQEKREGAHAPIEREEDFRRSFGQLAFPQDAPVLLEKFYRGEPHRCFLVNGTIVAAAHLRPASVLGDGTSTIDELVKEKNRKRKRYPSHRILALDNDEDSFLSRQRLSGNYIPAKGERVTLRPVSSPRGGGDAIDVTGSLTSAQTEFVEKAVRVIPGLSIAGVDVMFHAEGEPDGLVIVKVNGSPQISMHHHPWEGEARDVASAVLDAMFPNS